MALAGRESLRDIETCLSVHASIRQPAALELADRKARLYPCGVGAEAAGPSTKNATEYRLRPTRTIALCLCLSAHPHHPAALAGRISDQRLDMLLPEAGSSGAWRLCPPLCVAPSRGLLRHGACQVEHMPSRYSAPTCRPVICDRQRQDSSAAILWPCSTKAAGGDSSSSQAGARRRHRRTRCRSGARLGLRVGVPRPGRLALPLLQILS